MRRICAAWLETFFVHPSMDVLTWGNPTSRTVVAPSPQHLDMATEATEQVLDTVHLEKLK